MAIELLYLSGKVPRQELDWILGILRSSEGTSLLWWVGPLFDVNACGSLGVLDGLIGQGAKSTQESGLASLAIADEE